ncbi:hypothetical protein [Robinsoniella peoriensis]
MQMAGMNSKTRSRSS